MKTIEVEIGIIEAAMIMKITTDSHTTIAIRTILELEGDGMVDILELQGLETWVALGTNKVCDTSVQSWPCLKLYKT